MLAVVPRRVKVQVAALLAAAALLQALPWLLLAAHPLPAALLQAALVLLSGAVAWCLWPRFSVGVPRALRGLLPAPAGQPVRLSFDDGPTAGLSEAVLDLLARHRVRASFFVLVHKARANPSLVRRIVSEGHLLGLHGEDHRSPFFRPETELCESLARGRSELAALAGAAVDLYRPSHGRKTPALLRAVRRAGLRLCMWDLGVWDTDAPPAEVLLARLRAATPGRGGPGRPPPVVLLHDGLGDSPSAPPHGEPLLRALERWLPEISAPDRPGRAGSG